MRIYMQAGKQTRRVAVTEGRWRCAGVQLLWQSWDTYVPPPSITSPPPPPSLLCFSLSASIDLMLWLKGRRASIWNQHARAQKT